MQDKRTSTHRQYGFAASRLGSDELDKRSVVDLGSRALASRYEQVVKLRAMLEVRGWIDRHALCAENRFGTLRDEVTGRAIGNLAPHGEHFPRANEVELFRLIEDEDAGVHLCSLGRLTFEFTRSQKRTKP